MHFQRKKANEARAKYNRERLKKGEEPLLKASRSRKRARICSAEEIGISSQLNHLGPFAAVVGEP